jgi:hypothetical protein
MEFSMSSVENPGGQTANPFAGEAAPSPAQVNGAATVAQLRNEPGFMKGLQAHSPRERQAYLDRWEAAHKAQAGTPEAPSAFPQQSPSEVDGEGARLDYELSPKAPNEYVFSLPSGATADLALPQFRQEVFETGIAPAVANSLWKSLPAIEAMPQADYSAAVRAAGNAVKAQPGGAESVALALATGQRLAAKSVLWERAVQAAFSTPSGLLELARIGRKGAR